MDSGEKSLFVTGQFALALGIFGFLMNAFAWDNNYYVAFITGILLGLALAINLFFLIKFNKSTR